MAFIKKKQDDTTTTTQDGPSTFTSATAASDGGDPSQTAAPTADATPKGSGWTNLQDYLSANKGEGQPGNIGWY